MSDVAVSSGRNFAQVVRLVADVGDSKLGGRKERMREMAELRDWLEAWTADAKRNVASLERSFTTHDVEVEIADALRIHGAAKRASAAKGARKLVEESKRVRAVIGSCIGYLESNRSTVSMLANIGVVMDATEKKRARDVDRANSMLRTALTRLIDAIDDSLDVALVIAARLDPENSAPPRSLAEVEAALAGAAE